MDPKKNGNPNSETPNNEFLWLNALNDDELRFHLAWKQSEYSGHEREYLKRLSAERGISEDEIAGIRLKALVPQSAEIRCPSCDKDLTLDRDDLIRGTYECPACHSKQILSQAAETTEAKCASCGAELILDKDDLLRGVYNCPTCNAEHIVAYDFIDELYKAGIQKWIGGYNFGALLLTPLWLMAHGRAVLGLLLFVFYLPSPLAWALIVFSKRPDIQMLALAYSLSEFGLCLYFGKKGNQIAFDNRGNRSEAEIVKRESTWSMAGWIIAVIALLIEFIRCSGMN
jgi:Zn finger protein HypA/HybF involved in hydrogenase expression